MRPCSLLTDLRGMNMTAAHVLQLQATRSVWNFPFNLEYIVSLSAVVGLATSCLRIQLRAGLCSRSGVLEDDAENKEHWGRRLAELPRSISVKRYSTDSCEGALSLPSASAHVLSRARGSGGKRGGGDFEQIVPSVGWGRVGTQRGGGKVGYSLGCR